MMWHSLLKMRACPTTRSSSAATNTPPANINFALTIEPNNAALASARRGSRCACAQRASRRSRPRIRRKSLQSVPARGPAVGRGRCRAAGKTAGGGVRARSARARTSSMPAPWRIDRSRAADIIRLLDLKPHPEGGHYRETFRDARRDAERPRRLDRDLFPARARRALALASGRCRRDLALHAGRAAGAGDRGRCAADRRMRLGADLAAGERPQAVVPAATGRRPKASATGRWSAARSRRDSSSPASSWRRRAGSPCAS